MKNMKNIKNTKKTKRTFKMFAAWDYEFEAKEYDRMSERGWQLVSGGSFTQKYEFDDSVIYRYQLDYNNDIKDMTRYDETFRDAGWERVNSTFNGWHVFRKVYDPQKPEEEYEIYTDEQSRVDMLKRWRNVCYIFLCILPINIVNSIHIMETTDAAYIGVGLIIACGLMLGMLIAGMLSINKMIKGEKNTRPYPMKFFITLLFLLLAALLIASAFVLIQEGSYHVLGLVCGVLIGAVIVAVAVILSKKNTMKKR